MAEVTWEDMATPTRFAMSIGQEFLGVPYVPYPWILYVEQRVLEAVASPEQRFIMLNVPPQNGKTTTFGMFLSAWYLGMWPMNQVLFIAYAEEYAASWGVKTRDCLDRYGERYFGVGVSKSQTSGANWKTSQGFGGMLSAGILGGITGNPGHLIIIDDVIKTMEEASSVSTKRKHLQEFDGAIASRIQEGTTMLVTATRFAEDDLSGSIIERMDKEGYSGDQWEVISIPAIAEAPDYDEMDPDELEQWRDFLGRKHGEHLYGRYTARHYAKRRASIDPYTWSAVYQQAPSLSEGGMFPKQHWRYWDDTNIPTIGRQVRAWDLAATDGAGDWTVGTKMGLGTNGDLYVLGRERFQRNSAAVEQAVKDIAAVDGFGVRILIEQEKAGAGKSLVEHYKRLLAGYTVMPAKIDGSKEVRARPYSAMQNNGRVWLPRNDPKLCQEWITEHSKMMGDGRRPRHDDQIDTASYCTLDLIGEGATHLWIPGEDPDDMASAMMIQQARMGLRVG